MRTLPGLWTKKAIWGWIASIGGVIWKAIDAASNTNFVVQTLLGSTWLAEVGVWLLDYGPWLLLSLGVAWLFWVSGKEESAMRVTIPAQDEVDYVHLIPAYKRDADQPSCRVLHLNVQLRIYNDSKHDARLESIRVILLKKRAGWLPTRIEPSVVQETEIETSRKPTTHLPKVPSRDYIELSFSTVAQFPPEASFDAADGYFVRLLVKAVGEPTAKLDLSPQSNRGLFGSPR